MANAYHIKVRVDDSDQFWLSSGNWKNSSQPDIAPVDLSNPAKINAAKGNSFKIRRVNSEREQQRRQFH